MEQLRKLLRWTRGLRYPVRVLGATAIVASATLIQWLSLPLTVNHPYFLFVTSVAISALCFGKKTSLYTLALSCVALVVLFKAPPFGFGIRSDKKVTLIVFIIISLMAIVNGALFRRLAEILDELDEKQTVLRNEMHHRIINNLQVVSSTISWEATRADHEETRASLNRVARRITGIAHIAKALHQPDRQGLFDARDYFAGLVAEIAASLVGSRGIEIRCRAEAIGLNHETAELLGIAVNELITNAVKYAFPDDRNGTVDVELVRCPGGGGLRLTVADDGVGCGSGITKGTGLGLVSALTRLRGGNVEIHDAKPGCRVVVAM